MTFTKILIAIDSSTYSINAAKVGFCLARSLDAQVALVSVIDKNREIVNADLGIMPEQSATLLLKQAEESFCYLINLYGKGIETYKFTPEGIPYKEIINTAEVFNADLLILGAYGKTGLTRFLMGSVAKYVLKHSSVPVIIVPKNEK